MLNHQEGLASTQGSATLLEEGFRHEGKLWVNKRRDVEDITTVNKSGIAALMRFEVVLITDTTEGNGTVGESSGDADFRIGMSSTAGMIRENNCPYGRNAALHLNIPAKTLRLCCVCLNKDKQY